jgi:ubiquitin C-terminal hydrolase
VQCLLHAPPLVDLFVRGEWRPLVGQSPAGRVAAEFAGLTGRAWAGDSAALSPSSLKGAVAAVAPRFAGFAQQDAQELLAAVIDALHEGMSAGSADAFSGQLQSHVECPQCEQTEVYDEGFTTLAVPVRRPFTLAGCLEAFAEEEALGKGNEWRCTACGTPVRAKKKIAIWESGKCFVVHFKRFTVERKIDDAIDYPLEIDLAKFVAGPQGRAGPLRYRLYAVSEHHGGLNSGHYTTHAKVGDQWYLFDDATVREVKAVDARNGSAYLLHYERIDVSS